MTPDFLRPLPLSLVSYIFFELFRKLATRQSLNRSLSVRLYSNSPLASTLGASPLMGSTSTISLYSHPKLSLRAHPLLSRPYCRARGAPLPSTLPFNGTRRCFRLKRLVVTAAAPAEGGPSQRRVYRQSQSGNSLTTAPVKQIASFVVPAGVFVAATFGTQVFLITEFELNNNC